MDFRHFRLQVTGRVLLIAFSLYLCFYFYFQTRFYIIILLLVILSICLTWALMKYVQRTNRLLTRFFDSIEVADFADRMRDPYPDSGFRELSNSLNRIIAALADTRAEKEQQLHFFKSVIQKVGIGLITLKSDGSIDFINRSARRMLKVPHISNIRQLDQIDSDLAADLMAIESGQRKWINVSDGAQRAQLTLFAQQIIQPQQGGYKLLTLQNLQPELEEKESEAWKDLSRVLSHEIMNSMTPIASLATTALDLLPAKPELQSEKHADLHEAIRAISRRSRGLMQFVQNYRRFASIPVPHREPVGVERLFERLHALMQNQLAEHAIRFESGVVPNNLKIFIDPGLVEQVLLNIVTNSKDAVVNVPDPRIRLAASADHRARVSIQVTDNGRGMDESLLDKAFIPFFTTKTHGSGVGLSISRQIMRLHSGTVRIHSSTDQGTTVTLTF